MDFVKPNTSDRDGIDRTPSPLELKVLSLQPFYGGSHASFIDGWIRHSRHEWAALNLPARFWKWRMRHAAVEFSGQLDQMWNDGKRFDRIVTTDMLNVAEFRGLLKTAARDVPVTVYFHENQLVYPNQKEEPRDFHFAFTNLTSTLAADQVWFNSEFNRDSMAGELERVSRQWPDFRPTAAIGRIAEVGQIQPPGIEMPDEMPDGLGDCGAGVESVDAPNKPVHLVWAARWEHDKGPESLLNILVELSRRNVDFRISVIGQSFKKTPGVFQEIGRSFASKVVRFGFQESRREYWAALMEADVFLSTARHEFFGLSVVEAMAAGLVPVLPNRLAYPGLLAQVSLSMSVLYEANEEAVDAIERIGGRLAEVRDAKRKRDDAKRVAEQFDWPVRAAAMDDGLAFPLGASGLLI